MNLITDARLESLGSETLIFVPFYAEDSLQDAPDLRDLGGELLASLLQRGARSSLYEMTTVPSDGSLAGLLLVGAGQRGDIDPLTLLRIAAAASRYATKRGWTVLAAYDRGDVSAETWAEATVSGAVRGVYDPGLKKTNAELRPSLESLALVSNRSAESGFTSGALRGQIVAESAAIARDFVNLPPNDLTPSSLAERSRTIAADNGLDYEVLDEEAMEGLGMGSLLGVAAGSHEPPRLIVLRYGDRDAATKLALVGKGLTFDSGGLSLKTAQGMEAMKSDMGGAAAVIAGITAVARLGIEGISVTAYAGATENMPGGQAMRPGDVLTAMNGETIEVLNTDAEGRLVLADVLAYAVQQGATHIVDFATLTGAAVVALGKVASLACGTPGEWVDEVVAAGGEGFERAWRMPLFPEYRRAMDSVVADIKNVGGREAGSLTATAFLSDFVDDVPWTHMDIAGTTFNDRVSAYEAEGGTGIGVATIAALALRLSRA